MKHPLMLQRAPITASETLSAQALSPRTLVQFDRNGDRRYGESMPAAEPAGNGSAGGPRFGRAPRVDKRSDRSLYEDVCAALTAADLDASGIDVAVEAGTVTLSGRVTDSWTQRHAEDIAVRIAGVSEVNCELHCGSSPLPYTFS